jgi:uncharacterized membrane protein
MASELVVMKFDSTSGAQAAMNPVRALAEMNYAWIDDVAVVERHSSGRVATHTTHGSVTAGAAWGGLAGLFVGILFPPAILGWWAAGALGGALVEKATKETGLDKAMLDEIKDELDKGTSALILIGLSGDTDEMAKAFDKYKPVKVIRHDLEDKTVDNLKEALAASTEPEA